jgi:hypothetical protein
MEKDQTYDNVTVIMQLLKIPPVSCQSWAKCNDSGNHFAYSQLNGIDLFLHWTVIEWWWTVSPPRMEGKKLLQKRDELTVAAFESTCLFRNLLSILVMASLIIIIR